MTTHILHYFNLFYTSFYLCTWSQFSLRYCWYSFVRHKQHDDHTKKGRPFPCLCPMASSSLEGSPIHSHLCRSHPNPLQESRKREKSFLVADSNKNMAAEGRQNTKALWCLFWSFLSLFEAPRGVESQTIPSQHLKSQVFNAFSSSFTEKHLLVPMFEGA